MLGYAIQKESIPRFLLKISLYWNSGRNTGKTGFKASRYKPDHQSKLSAPACAHERRASTLVVGVIANEFHKVLVYIWVQVAYLGNERRMQPISKVTRPRSKVKSSRRIRCIHEDLRAHWSTQTISEQAHTHIYDMRAHLAVF